MQAGPGRAARLVKDTGGVMNIVEVARSARAVGGEWTACIETPVVETTDLKNAERVAILACNTV